jgi:hypothetical protein
LFDKIKPINGGAHRFNGIFLRSKGTFVHKNFKN